MKVKKITLNTSTKLADFVFDDDISCSLSFEFLRVFAPTETAKQQKQANSVVSHKKDIRVTAVEPVGKHGYRLLFDDQFSDIYSVLLLKELAFNQDSLWQNYLTKIDQGPHSREAMIEIKEVK